MNYQNYLQCEIPPLKEINATLRQIVHTSDVLIKNNNSTEIFNFLVEQNYTYICLMNVCKINKTHEKQQLNYIIQTISQCLDSIYNKKLYNNIKTLINTSTDKEQLFFLQTLIHNDTQNNNTYQLMLKNYIILKQQYEFYIKSNTAILLPNDKLTLINDFYSINQNNILNLILLFMNQYLYAKEYNYNNYIDYILYITFYNNVNINYNEFKNSPICIDNLIKTIKEINDILNRYDICSKILLIETNQIDSYNIENCIIKTINSYNLLFYNISTIIDNIFYTICDYLDLIIKKQDKPDNTVYYIHNNKNIIGEITITTVQSLYTTFDYIKLNDKMKRDNVYSISIFEFIVSTRTDYLTYNELENLIDIISQIIFYSIQISNYGISNNKYLAYFTSIIKKQILLTNNIKSIKNNITNEEIYSIIQINILNYYMQLKFILLNSLYHIFISTDKEYINNVIINLKTQSKECIDSMLQILKETYHNFYKHIIIIKNININHNINHFDPMCSKHFISTDCQDILILLSEIYSIQFFIDYNINKTDNCKDSLIKNLIYPYNKFDFNISIDYINNFFSNLNQSYNYYYNVVNNIEQTISSITSIEPIQQIQNNTNNTIDKNSLNNYPLKQKSQMLRTQQKLIAYKKNQPLTQFINHQTISQLQTEKTELLRNGKFNINDYNQQLLNNKLNEHIRQTNIIKDDTKNAMLININTINDNNDKIIELKESKIDESIDETTISLLNKIVVKQI